MPTCPSAQENIKNQVRASLPRAQTLSQALLGCRSFSRQFLGTKARIGQMPVGISKFGFAFATKPKPNFLGQLDSLSLAGLPIAVRPVNRTGPSEAISRSHLELAQVADSFLIRPLDSGALSQGERPSLHDCT